MTDHKTDHQVIVIPVVNGFGLVAGQVTDIDGIHQIGIICSFAFPQGIEKSLFMVCERDELFGFRKLTGIRMLFRLTGVGRVVPCWSPVFFRMCIMVYQVGPNVFSLDGIPPGLFSGIHTFYKS